MRTSCLTKLQKIRNYLTKVFLQKGMTKVMLCTEQYTKVNLSSLIKFKGMTEVRICMYLCINAMSVPYIHTCLSYKNRFFSKLFHDP